MARLSTIPRILFFNRSFYFDSTNGAAVASRALMEALHRHGHATEVVCGTVVDAGPEAEPGEFLANFGIPGNRCQNSGNRCQNWFFVAKNEF